MKKKGLIISTAVMVVVLIAALTTGTFAWFSLSAEASIADFELVTKAADGLQIATYYGTTSGAGYTYGNITLDETNKYWKGDQPGYGQSLTIAGEGAQIVGMYGASGDGINMFYNADSSQVLEATGKPKTFAAATANVNFFQLDFVLHSTSAKDNSTIFVKQLDVDVAGETSKTGMAGSVRIALFATETAGEWSDSVHFATQTVKGTGKFLYDPYAKISYNGGAWIKSNDIGNYAIQADAYGTSMSKQAINAAGSDWQDKYLEGKFDSTDGPAKHQFHSEAFGTLAEATGVNGSSLFNIGTVKTNQDIYLRLVIWFDGEDSACNQTFAGGGVNVTINFGLDVPASPGA